MPDFKPVCNDDNDIITFSTFNEMVSAKFAFNNARYK